MKLWHIVVGLIAIEVALGAFIAPATLVFPFLTGAFFLAARYLAPDRDFRLLFRRTPKRYHFILPILIVGVVLTWNTGTDLADLVVRLFYGTLAGSVGL